MNFKIPISLQNFPSVLKNIAKKYRASYGRDVILDLRGIDLNQIEDNIIYDLENAKQDNEQKRKELIQERYDKIKQLESEIVTTDSKNINGEIIIKVPTIVKNRMPESMFSKLQKEIRNLDKVQEQIKALKKVKDAELKRQAEEAKKCK